MSNFLLRSAFTLLGVFATVGADPSFPQFPTQFQARVEVTAHLVDRTQDYPPWLRVIDVSYDYQSRKALAVVKVK